MSRPLWYDRTGNPISGPDAYTAKSDWANKHVKLSRITSPTRVGEWFVSTVWLGLDHSFGDGPPMIFETLVFAPSSDAELADDMTRYPTEAEAEQGHDTVVKLICQSLTDPAVEHFNAWPKDKP